MFCHRCLGVHLLADEDRAQIAWWLATGCDNAVESKHSNSWQQSHNPRSEDVSDVIEIYVFTALALVASGVVIGFLAVVSLGIHRDDRRGGFPADTNGRVARGVRRATGTYTRGPELSPNASRNQEDTWAQ